MSQADQPTTGILPTDVLAGLYAIGTGQVRHVYMGMCPDAIEGAHVRDEDCPACRTLMAVDEHLQKSGIDIPA